MKQRWRCLAAIGCTLLANNLVGQVFTTTPDSKLKSSAEALAPFPEPLKRNELQQEAAKVKSAKGPWQQVAVIESLDDEGDPLVGDSTVATNNRPAAKPRFPNPNVIAFLDNRRLLVADGANPIRVFDADTGRLLKSFGEPLAPDGSGWRRNIAVSPDGRFVMLLPDGTPRIWDTVEGTLAASLPAASNSTEIVRAADGKVLASIPDGIVAFSPDGRHVAAKRNFVPTQPPPELKTKVPVVFVTLARPYVVLWNQTSGRTLDGK